MKNRHIKSTLSFTPAFTLIELMVVISIIALLASIVLAALSTARAKATVAAGQTFEGQMYQAYGANAVAIWNFDEGSGSIVKDTSGSNNNLTVDSTLTTAGWATQAQAFRGRSAFIPTLVAGTGPTFPANATISAFNPANGSVSFWINLVQPSSQAGIFCSSTYFQFCIADSTSNSNGNFIQVNWKSPAVHNVNTSILANSVLGKWTQVAVSWSSAAGTMNIYVNGSIATSTPYTAATQAIISPLTFCAGGDCAGTDVVGTIDEMRVYSQSLQTGAIEKIYADELPAHMLADAR